MRTGSALWYDAHPDAPDAVELALEAAERDAAHRTYLATNPQRPCQPLTLPGTLCSTCWTDHTGSAA